MGYDEESRASRVWVPERQTVVISKEVRFNERQRVASPPAESFDLVDLSDDDDDMPAPTVREVPESIKVDRDLSDSPPEPDDPRN